MGVREKLLGAFRCVFPNVPEDVLVREDASVIEGWDSLQSIALITEIEKQFSIRFPLEAMSELTSFSAFLNALDHAPNVSPVPRKKGIITDLDGTLWEGIVGEGDDIRVHEDYRDFLREAAKQGILIGIATRNDAQLVKALVSLSDAFEGFRQFIFPIEADWGAKSPAVARILKTWNVSAQDVVFVDDSFVELEEVKNMFPDITLMPYDERATAELRKYFPPREATPEDLTRVANIKAGVQFQRELASAAHMDDFLLHLNGEIEFTEGWTPRVQELIEKVNQFNMNGIRWAEDTLKSMDVVVSVDYRDKFGLYGTVAAYAGDIINGDELILRAFVLSCRVFNRRIEYHMLSHMFTYVDRVSLHSAHRSEDHRNRAFMHFLSELPLNLTAETFPKQTPMLPHSVIAI